MSQSFVSANAALSQFVSAREEVHYDESFGVGKARSGRLTPAFHQLAHRQNNAVQLWTSLRDVHDLMFKP